MNTLNEEMQSFKGYGKVDALHQERLNAKKKSRRRICIICIICLVLVAIIASVAVAVVRSKSSRKNEDPTQLGTTSKAMTAVCSVTLYEDKCITSLSSYSGASKLSPKDLFDIAVVVALREAQNAVSLVSNLTQKITDPMQKEAFSDCGELIDQTVDQLSSSSDDLKNFNIKSLIETSGNARTWLSAALTNLDTCVDGLANASSGEAKSQMQSIVDNLTQLTSNSLAIISNVGKLLQKFKISFPTRRLLMDDFNEDGFPRWVSATDRRLLQANGIQANVTVAKDGTGKYLTIQEAVNGAPNKSDSRYVIWVKQGIYRETVEVSKSKTMLMLVGDGMDKTIVTGDKSFGTGTKTFHTATFVAVGKGFIAQDIQIRNTAGASNHQAVAIRVGSDESVFVRCNISAYQDTLYAHSLRQFYRDCYISGTVDFIFGNAAVVFQNCIIAARLPDANQKNTITAQGRTDPNQNTGISIHNCNITGEADLIANKNTSATYLGRPWKLYSRTVIMTSNMDGIIDPAGWLEWNGDFALKTLYYAEYQNTGTGAALGARVTWPGYQKTPDKSEISKFTVGEFIGTSWLQATKVTFSDGLTA